MGSLKKNGILNKDSLNSTLIILFIGEFFLVVIDLKRVFVRFPMQDDFDHDRISYVAIMKKLIDYQSKLLFFKWYIIILCNC